MEHVQRGSIAGSEAGKALVCPESAASIKNRKPGERVVSKKNETPDLVQFEDRDQFEGIKTLDSIPSGHPHFSTDYTAEQKTRAAATMAAARKWAESNPHAWSLICSYLSERVARKQHTQFANAVAEALDRRAVHPTAPGGYALDHNLCAALARIYLESHPEAVNYIETRRSYVDAAFQEFADPAQMSLFEVLDD